MIYYSPLISYYKSHRGAVPAGEKVTFRVVMPRSFGVTACYLVLSQDGRADESRNMVWEQTDGNGESWVIDFVSEKAGLFFYHFAFDGGFGRCDISKDKHGFGGVIGEGGVWQLTVYENTFETPGFIKGGVFYQIFPDRFNTSDETKTGIPTDRVLRDDYDELPVYRPDSKGVIRNNDFFCGDFRGITEKLDYIASLGVTCIYLNPICESHSNHRYDTADYMKPDPLLGTEEDFSEMCSEAAKRNIAVILDGVFSHTGADSRYFNKYGRYGESVGAYNDEASPYRPWYSFGKTRDEYQCWWNFDTLPEVNENNPAFTEFICGENGVIAHWLSLGASGFRLDVADELPNEFLDNIRRAVKSRGSDKLIIGEVWEDATNKISGGGRRRFLLGSQLDSVMNYPFKDAIVAFMLTRNANAFMTDIVSVVDNYPPQAMNCCMNILGTHDTARILTVLSGVDCDRMTREDQAVMTKSVHATFEGRLRLKAAISINFFLPGVPCIYYGDEAGLTGGKDPFNRRCFPWGQEDNDILEYTRAVSSIRKQYPVCEEGGFYPLSAELSCIAFLRFREGEKRVAVICNMNSEPIDYRLNHDMREMQPLIGGTKLHEEGAVRIPEKTTCIIADL